MDKLELRRKREGQGQRKAVCHLFFKASGQPQNPDGKQVVVICGDEDGQEWSARSTLQEKAADRRVMFLLIWLLSARMRENSQPGSNHILLPQFCQNFKVPAISRPPQQIPRTLTQVGSIDRSVSAPMSLSQN